MRSEVQELGEVSNSGLYPFKDIVLLHGPEHGSNPHSVSLTLASGFSSPPARRVAPSSRPEIGIPVRARVREWV